MRLVYFASVRERVGRTEEELEPPGEVATVGDLIGWLRSRGEGYEAAFAEGSVIRAALDHAHVQRDAAIAGAREIAFFPPMTGG